jgi:hypothetical protein
MISYGGALLAKKGNYKISFMGDGSYSVEKFNVFIS